MFDLDNIYLIAVKNKGFLPHALLLVIGMIIKKNGWDVRRADGSDYLGDNLPLDLADRIKNA